MGNIFKKEKNTSVIIAVHEAGLRGMKHDYSPETDITTMTISDERPDYGVQAGSIINHYSEDGRPVEIEILDASETTLSIETILSRSKGRAKP